MRRDWMTVWVLVGCLIGSTTLAQDVPAKGPATVEEGIEAIDLANLPLVEGAKTPGERNAASLNYEAPKESPDVYAFYKDLLTKQGWKELGEASVMKEAASSTFGKGGFTLAFSAFSTGRPGKSNVIIQLLGNVDLAKLPRPAGTVPFYEGPASAMYLAEGEVEANRKAVREALLKAGWEPYGDAGDVRFYKKNAIKLSARVSAAPAQAGKTMIDYGTVFMAADLPAPASATRVQYSDQPIQLSADALGSQDEVVAFYKERLGLMGWKPTTPKPFKSGNRNVLYFRNDAKDMIRLELGAFEGQTRYLLRKQSAQAVAKAADRVNAIRKDAEGRQKAMAAKAAAGPARLAIALPEGADKVDLKAHTLRFQVPAGSAQAAVTAYRAAFKKDGWKEVAAVLQPMAGNLTIAKGDLSLSITYSDTGVLPSEISMLATGAELATTPAP